MKRALKIAMVAGAAILSGCGPYISSLCEYDWRGTLVCEERAHHFAQPSVFAMYAYDQRTGQLIPLYPSQAESFLQNVPMPTGLVP